jgi:hypothetical protein
MTARVQKLTAAFDRMIAYFEDLTMRFPKLQPLSDKFSKNRNLKLFLTVLSTIPEIIEIADEEHDEDRERIAKILVERLFLEYDMDVCEYPDKDIEKINTYILLWADTAINGL